MEKVKDSIDARIDRFLEMIEKSREEFNEKLEKSRIEAETAAEKRRNEAEATAEKRRSEHEKEKADFNERMKKLEKQIGGISKSNGDMAEEAIFNALGRDLTFAGIKFDDIGRNWKRNVKKLQLRGEYDVILENGDTVALIETKYKVQKEDITKLFTKEVADKFRILFSDYKDYKILLGVGGMSFDDDAIDEAKNNGVGIIKVVGDTVEFYTEGIREY